MTRFKAFIRSEPEIDGLSMFLIRQNEGSSNVALAIEDLAFVKPGEQTPRAAHVSDTAEIVQAIVNAAWDAGIRPHGYKDDASSITRIEDHLADMRALVFHTDPPKGKVK